MLIQTFAWHVHVPEKTIRNVCVCVTIDRHKQNKKQKTTEYYTFGQRQTEAYLSIKCRSLHNVYCYLANVRSILANVHGENGRSIA